MTEAVTASCERHPERFDCPDILIHYSPRSRCCGIIIHDGGSSFVTIDFCPWCGSSLTKRTKATGRRKIAG
jgi:rRNA maturation endonuclease Nob1